MGVNLASQRCACRDDTVPARPQPVLVHLRGLLRKPLMHWNLSQAIPRLLALAVRFLGGNQLEALLASWRQLATIGRA